MFNQDPDEDLIVQVSSNALVEDYSNLPVAKDIMATPTLAAQGVTMNLECLCPIPLSWAPYFMDNKTPYQA
jgi:hypothetical protein